MKVVLFCGGYGMRMRNSADDGMPKPMQMVGPRPLIWHVMRYYAHFGHKEFILCLGYGAGAHQELLPDVSGSNVERFRDARRPNRTDALRHQRLVDHLRRHRTRVGDRRAAASRAWTSRRR